MKESVDYLLKELQDPKKEMNIIRTGLKTTVVDSFLAREDLAIKDVLARLDVSASTYFAKKKNHQTLDPHTTEKFIRLISVMKMASDILGEGAARKWIYHRIPSLGNEVPIDMLDTEPGHRLVEQALLQIKHGVYS